jgi:hypothetical protein
MAGGQHEPRNGHRYGRAAGVFLKEPGWLDGTLTLLPDPWGPEL